MNLDYAKLFLVSPYEFYSRNAPVIYFEDVFVFCNYS